jgi:drug/metabolite transporter (DMT)-like permease
VQLVGVLFGLASGAIWGSGDFLGGLAAKRSHEYQVLALSASSGLVLLVVLAVLFGEAAPSAVDVAWAGAAGVSGAVGIAFLYQGLASGSAATVAPAAAVISAALPAVFSSLTAGLPRSTQLAGFALAIAGIWLVARSPSAGGPSGTGLRLAIVAGTCFGAFLILIARVDSQLVFAPLAVARTAALVAAFALMSARGIRIPQPASNPTALWAGILDAGGNVFYLMARQHTRLDVAAVLASLYPVATIVLARLVSHERIGRTQWIGAVVCLVAVVLIVMGER